LRLKESSLLRTGDMSNVRLAKPNGRLNQRIKDCLEIESRAADDLEHVGGSGLLLQRLAQLVEQARVLDGDDGLAGEIGHQLDLFVGERSNLSAVDADRADQAALFEHRNDQKGASAE